MRDELILKKAIKKAFKNGYKGRLITKIESGTFVTHCDFIELIFSHDFAKAFWGEYMMDIPVNLKVYRQRLVIKQPTWQHHLQTMVLEEQPLKYLEKFLEENKNE